ncbi:MAG TPA: glycosyltransferase family 9 protein [bacterium]|nr:glycosyltransferase family 9 protein [bacterium]HOL34285.1 glycosyltransferase family 9 protein [bacterium]HPP07659.1 glycosyltransferase family 9 protein [bacterium]
MRKENHKSGESVRVLIIDGTSIESCLLLTPVIKQIKDHDNVAKIDIVATAESEKFLKEYRWFDRIIVHKKHGFIRTYRTLCTERYKLIISFRPSIIPYILRAKTKLNFLKIRIFTDRFFTHESINFLRLIEPVFGKPEKVELFFPVSEIDREKVKEFLKSKNISNSSTLVAIHIGNTDILDQWDVSNYIKVCDTLIEEYNAKILVFGNKNDPVVSEIINSTKYPHDIIDMSQTVNFREIAAFLSRANLAITRNGSFLYLACAVKTPIVAIFGAGNPYRFGPVGTRYINIHSQIDCFPCNRKYRCTKNYQCIKSITSDAVIEAARLILDENKQLYLFE